MLFRVGVRPGEVVSQFQTGSDHPVDRCTSLGGQGLLLHAVCSHEPYGQDAQGV
jgi:hypothetical protein